MIGCCWKSDITISIYFFKQEWTPCHLWLIVARFLIPRSHRISSFLIEQEIRKQSSCISLACPLSDAKLLNAYPRNFPLQNWRLRTDRNICDFGWWYFNILSLYKIDRECILKYKFQVSQCAPTMHRCRWLSPRCSATVGNYRERSTEL